MTKLRAFFCHLAMSCLIVSTVLAIIIFFWYPDPFFKVIGAMEVIRVLIFVDLVLGPLLTLVLYRPGKWGLKFDMACVFVLQLSALCYGIYTVYEERPYYTVFVIDRFEVLARKDVAAAEVSDGAFGTKPWTQPIYVAATLPEDMQERERLMEEVLFEGKPDIDQRPEYWSPYEEKIGVVSQVARPLTELLKSRPDKAEVITEAMESYANGESLRYLPVTARQRALTMLIDSETWHPVGALDIDPWKKPAANIAANAAAANGY